MASPPQKHGLKVRRSYVIIQMVASPQDLPTLALLPERIAKHRQVCSTVAYVQLQCYS